MRTRPAGVTREQQQATRELQRAEEAWLRAYGWQQQGLEWTHPRLTKIPAYSRYDAMQETLANPRLGWPDRGYSRPETRG